MVVMYLCIPEMRGEVVGAVTQLKGQYLMHRFGKMSWNMRLRHNWSLES